MIRWCSYCQAFVGERFPFDDPTFTHTVCPTCEARLERDEDVSDETAPLRTLFARILASARAGDEPACAACLAEARSLGLREESILVGMLQPALYRAGLEWQEGRMSVAAEHRFTSWCERAFAMLGPTARPQAPIDLLIVQAPDNAHTLGPRFAARVLGSSGLAVEAVVPALPPGEIVAAARELQPRIIGFSCALPSQVRGAEDLVARVRGQLEPELRCRYVLSGFALRLGEGTPVAVAPGVEVVVHLDALRGRAAEASPPGRGP